jgi:hypothetical protein
VAVIPEIPPNKKGLMVWKNPGLYFLSILKDL